jgi:hypothetical protein
MPSGGHGATTQRARQGEPQPVPGPSAAPDNDSNQREPTRKDLTSWWRSFKRGNQRREEEGEQFPLADQRTLPYAPPSDNKWRPALAVQKRCAIPPKRSQSLRSMSSRQLLTRFQRQNNSGASSASRSKILSATQTSPSHCTMRKARATSTDMSP